MVADSVEWGKLKPGSPPAGGKKVPGGGRKATWSV